MGDGLRKEQVRNSFPLCLYRWQLVQSLSLAQPSQDTSVSCQNHTSTSDHQANFSPHEQHPHPSKLRHQSRAAERAAWERPVPQCKREQRHKTLNAGTKSCRTRTPMLTHNSSVSSHLPFPTPQLWIFLAQQHLIIFSFFELPWLCWQGVSHSLSHPSLPHNS